MLYLLHPAFMLTHCGGAEHSLQAEMIAIRTPYSLCSACFMWTVGTAQWRECAASWATPCTACDSAAAKQARRHHICGPGFAKTRTCSARHCRRRPPPPPRPRAGWRCRRCRAGSAHGPEDRPNSTAAGVRHQAVSSWRLYFSTRLLQIRTSNPARRRAGFQKVFIPAQQVC